MRALVLGAGIQGCCSALALAGAGWDVELIDRADAPMRGASANGEGKVHLGLVYGNEPSRRTAALMLDGALAFGPLLDRFVGGGAPLDWPAMRSEPFHYVVLPRSLVTADDLRDHYAWVSDAASERVRDGAQYLGTAPTEVIAEIAPEAVPGLRGPVVAAFRSAEVSVDPAQLRAHVVGALDRAGIETVGGRTVEAVSRVPGGFSVELSSSGAVERRPADAVVNCLWDGRLAVDATLDLLPTRPWVYRYKCGVTGTVPAGVELPASCTFVLGPFGDVVVRRGREVYASWYPQAVLGWSTEVRPPGEWTAPGALDAETAGNVARAMLDEFAELVPSLARLEDLTVTGGVIVAWGESDIDEPTSDLHERHEIGVHDHDGYVSIDTGKLTTAPLFADRMLDVL